MKKVKRVNIVKKLKTADCPVSLKPKQEVAHSSTGISRNSPEQVWTVHTIPVGVRGLSKPRGPRLAV